MVRYWCRACGIVRDLGNGPRPFCRHGQSGASRLADGADPRVASPALTPSRLRREERGVMGHVVIRPVLTREQAEATVALLDVALAVMRLENTYRWGAQG